MPERTDHPPSSQDDANDERSGGTARRAVIGGVLGLALLLGPVALATVLLPDGGGAAHHDDRASAAYHRAASPADDRGSATDRPTSAAPARQRRWPRRPQQLRHVGRTGTVRDRRQMVHQHRQRLLRRPAVLAQLLAGSGRHGLPPRALTGDPDRHGPAAVRLVGLGRLAGLYLPARLALMTVT